METFIRWVETTPVYQAERKRVVRRLKQEETPLALIGLACALVLAAAVATVAFSLDVRISVHFLAIHALLQGWTATVCIGIIRGGADDQSSRRRVRKRLAPVPSHQIVWGRVLAWLVSNPRQLRRTVLLATVNILFWSLMDLGFARAGWKEILAWVGYVSLAVLGSAVLTVEGGVIGVACNARNCRSYFSLLAATIWVAMLAFIPVLYAVALGGPWSGVPRWTWYVVTLALHLTSGLIAYAVAIQLAEVSSKRE